MREQIPPLDVLRVVPLRSWRRRNRKIAVQNNFETHFRGPDTVRRKLVVLERRGREPDIRIVRKPGPLERLLRKPDALGGRGRNELNKNFAGLLRQPGFGITRPL